MAIEQSAPAAGTFPDLQVACVQMEPRVGLKTDNLARALARVDEAAASGARLVVLPELATSGYVFASRAEAFEAAEAVPDGAAARAWIDIAQRLAIHLVVGMAERAGQRLYNSALIAGPDGYIGTYRKLHLWNEEHLFFESGDLGLPVFDTPIGRLGVAICYDAWFPEVFRLLAMKGADIVCVPTNWVPMPNQPAQRAAMATTLAMAGAHSNGVNVLCANRVGVERGQPFIGQSLVVGPDGWPLAGPASADREETIHAHINLKRTRLARHLNAFNDVLRDRRGDVYDPMLGTGWPRPRY